MHNDEPVNRHRIRGVTSRKRWSRPVSTIRGQRGSRGFRVLRVEALEQREYLAADLAITEFMASNGGSLFDSDGDTPDWIEIHNANDETVNLSGWSLTDDARQPDKWRFPFVGLGADDYLVVFASGKDRVSDELHTNFKLSAAGEYLALVDDTGSIVQEFAPAFPKQFTDVAYGVNPADGELVYLPQPTPGRANTDGSAGVTQENVTFSHAGGTFVDPFTLTLDSEAPGKTVVYTVDGSVPNEDSARYDGPITIDGTTQVRARLVEPGLSPGPVTAESYVRLTTDVADFTSRLPIMVIDNFGAGPIPNKGWTATGAGVQQLARQPASVMLFEREGDSSRILSAPEVSSRMGIRVRGSSSSELTTAKPYSMETWGAGSDDDAGISPFGMAEESDWVLYPPWAARDRALIDNTFLFRISNQMGHWAPDFQYVEAFVNSDGGDLTMADYAGLYVLEEKVKRSAGRLDFQKFSPDATSGGWLLGINRMDPISVDGQLPKNFHTAGPDGVLQTPADLSNGSGSGDDIPEHRSAYFNFDSPNGYRINQVQRQAIEDWMRGMEDVLYGRADVVWNDPVNGYAKYIDVDSFIDHFILHNLAAHSDALWLSMWVYNPDPANGGKLTFGPVWDVDLDGFEKNPESFPLRRADKLWYGRLFSDPNFMERYIDRWNELRSGPFSNAKMSEVIDDLFFEIGVDAAERHGTPFWVSRLEAMRTWVVERAEAIDRWADDALVDRPTLSHPGGVVPAGFEVTLSGGVGDVYYTLDGTDPRLLNGGVAPDAVLAGGPTTRLTLDATTGVQARSRVGDEWSGLTEGLFVVDGSPDDVRGLAVTEINYHPYDPTHSELIVDPSFEDDDFEFIELANTGSHTIDLAGMEFVDGIAFSFGAGETSALAPGQVALVVADRDAFAARYGDGLPVVGEFASGRLDNGGERITLVDRYGTVVQDVRYDDTDGWPARADGTGSSLELVETASDASDPGTWRASSEYGGSPGREGAGPVFDVLVNEILSRGAANDPDRIELVNTTADTVDLSGWYLSDDENALRKSTIPPGTAIGAGEYLVLEPSFGLSGTEGDDVWLIEADGSGRPVRFVDHVKFDATDVGVSLGRFPDGDPAGILSPMARRSFGAANTEPAAGPVIVSEVHYLPPKLPPIVAEDFSDATPADFTPVPGMGTWAVRDGRYEVTPGAEAKGDTIATIVTDRALPRDFVFATTLGFRTVAPFKQNGMLVFDYESPTNFKFVLMNEKTGKVRIGQRDAAGWNFLVGRTELFEAGLDVEIALEIKGSVVRVRVGGSLKLEYNFATELNQGQVGVGSKNGTASFDRVTLEVLADPQDLEFLELTGTAAGAVDIGGWRLGAGVELTFAPATPIEAGETLVVVGFDPGDVDRAELFREVFGIDESVALAGPYQGRLGDSGDVVRLLKPVVPANRDSPFVLVDQVGYDDQFPWPTMASGQGRALSRATANAFGNAASSWSALVPTPGSVHFAQAGDLDFDGDVDAADSRMFVQILLNRVGYLAAFGEPMRMVADVDGDGDVDFDDIDDLLALQATGASSPATEYRRYARPHSVRTAIARHGLQVGSGRRAALVDRVMQAGMVFSSITVPVGKPKVVGRLPSERNKAH